jgi:hypothetical protein
MIDYADKDKDGGIGYEEFVAVVTKQFPKVWSYNRNHYLIRNFKLKHNFFEFECRIIQV